VRGVEPLTYGLQHIGAPFRTVPLSSFRSIALLPFLLPQLKPLLDSPLDMIFFDGDLPDTVSKRGKGRVETAILGEAALKRRRTEG
jgi:hypothetical protein